MRLVLRRAALLAVAGVAMGTVGAAAVTRFLEKLLYGVTPADAPTFIAVALLLAGVAVFAAWIPAQRAMRVDPVVALRYE
jgi:ABC-type antimicrobial peptide transport system permease subunit